MARGPQRTVPILVALLLAACGDGSNTAEFATDSPSHRVHRTATAGPSGGDGASNSFPILRTDGFVMPSGSKYCELDRRILSCVITSGLPPPAPDEPCPVDLIGLAIEATGGVTPMCSGDPGIIFDPTWPTLVYGQTWIRAHIACESASTSLSCSNRVGHAFTLSTSGWTST
jgi:hypothetical protein